MSKNQVERERSGAGRRRPMSGIGVVRGSPVWSSHLSGEREIFAAPLTCSVRKPWPMSTTADPYE